MIEDLIELMAMENIAEHLEEDDLISIGSTVVEGYDGDRQDRGEWEDKMKDAMDLALQNAKEKTFPWPKASNVMMPVITEAIVQYQARMYPALIPPVDIVKARIVGTDPEGEKQNSAIRVSKYMTWECLEQDEDWEEEMDRGLIVQPLLGQFYKKTYWDSNKGHNIGSMLSPHEFVMVNNAKSVKDSFRKTHYFPMNANEVKSQQLQGNYLDIELNAPVDEPGSEEVNEARQTSQLDDSTPYLMLEQHTWLDLDEDGLMEPYIVTVEHNSRKVLRIVACFNEDGIKANEDGEVYDVEQEQFFVKYGFIPNPDGSIMDLGLGQLLSPLNKQINTNINQLNDAGTLSVTGGGLLGRGLKIKGGVIKRRMGQYTTVNSAGQDLSRNIVHFPEVKPSAVLFNLLGMMMTAAQRIASTLDSQVGENPGQNQKATTTMAVQEEGKRIFSGIYKRNHRSLKKEFKRRFYLNSLYLPFESYLNVLDGVPEDKKEAVGETLFRSDFDQASMNIIPTADSNYTSEQMKMAKSQALLQKIETGLVNPKVVMKQVLEAEEQPNIDQLMTLPEPQPPFIVTKHRDEMNLAYAKLMLDATDKEAKWINDEILTNATAMLNIAKAEGEEVGTQLDEYRAELETLTMMAEQNQLRRKEAQESAQKAQQPAQPAPQAAQ
jgi:chaperonin GroES